MLPLQLAAAWAWFLLLLCICPRSSSGFDCYNCTSTDCLKDLQQINQTTCETSCYTKFDGGVLSRGCIDKDVACPDKSCVQCKTDKCNTNNICQSCASSEDCASKKSATALICGVEQNSCILIVKDVKVERRCGISTETCEAANDACFYCGGPNCNDAVPMSKTPLNCFKCSGAACASVAPADAKPEPCAHFNATDKCYISGTNDTTLKRGCLSEAAAGECAGDCSTCDGDGCNKEPFKRDQPVKCIQCDSSKQANCSEAQQGVEAKACSQQITLFQNASCYVELLPNKTVQRGCLYDRPAELGDCKAPTCTTCSTEGCNNHTSELPASFTCIRCRSDLEPKCSKEADKLKGRTCDNAALAETVQKCYTGTWNDRLIRGCLVDISNMQKFDCAGNGTAHCQICNERDCNKARFSGAAKLQMASSCLVIAVVLLRSLF